MKIQQARLKITRPENSACHFVDRSEGCVHLRYFDMSSEVHQGVVVGQSLDFPTPTLSYLKDSDQASSALTSATSWRYSA